MSRSAAPGERDRDPPSPWHATWGPADGPIRYRDNPGVLGIVAELGTPWPILGEAHPDGWLPDDRGPVATYRLRIAGAFLDGRFTCVARAFRPATGIGDGPEDATGRTAREGHQSDLGS